MSVAEIESVNDADALDDQVWFNDRPNGFFRARAGKAGLWLIRRRRQGADTDVYLRTLSRTALPEDDDRDLALLWFSATYPDWSAAKALKQARKTLKRGPR